LTATLHDMTCWLLPEFHQSANVAAEKRFAERIWKQAAGLIAVSESTRRDAVKVLDLNPGSYPSDLSRRGRAVFRGHRRDERLRAFEVWTPQALRLVRWHCRAS
jgi:hypothetical protein